jgi:hypothetical protein
MYHAGATVIEYDDVGDNFYFILKGELLITIPQNKEKYQEIKRKIGLQQVELDNIKGDLRRHSLHREKYAKKMSIL